MQYLLDRAYWSADMVQVRLYEYVKEELGTCDAVLVLDETGFLKKGVHSPGSSASTVGRSARAAPYNSAPRFVAFPISTCKPVQLIVGQ